MIHIHIHVCNTDYGALTLLMLLSCPPLNFAADLSFLQVRFFSQKSVYCEVPLWFGAEAENLENFVQCQKSAASEPLTIFSNSFN